MHLITDGLVIYQRTVFYQIPLLGFNALVIVPNGTQRSNLGFIGNEVDLLIEKGTRIIPIEIKSSQTIGEQHLKGLRYYQQLNASGSSKGLLIYGGEERQDRSKVTVLSFRQIGNIRSILSGL